MAAAQIGTIEKSFVWRILLPGSIILAVTAILGGLALVSAGRGVDQVSLEGQQFEAWRATSRELDELSLAQESLAICDRCAKEALSADPDRNWLSENIALKLFDLYDVDETYILDGQDQPVFAAIGGMHAAPADFSAIAPQVRYFVDLARGRVKRPSGQSNYNERLPGAPVRVESTARTTDRAIHSSDLVDVNGRIALISVMQMRQAEALAGETPLLLNLRYLDESFLSKLAKQNFLADPRLAQTPQPAEDESFVPVMDSEGKPLTNLIWKPLLPAEQLIRSLLPAAAAVFVIIAALVLLMSLKLRDLIWQDQQNMRELQQAHIELQAKEAQAHHLAYHDALTGLPNRVLFNDRAENALTRARQGEPMAFLLLDLDRFKNVNDRFGHLAGDELIQQVGRRLKALLNQSSCVARLGGDEFAILLGKEDVEDGIEPKLQLILEAIRQPFDLFGNQAHVGVSIGIVTAPRYGVERTELMRKADIALYRAKEEGRDCYRFFDTTMDETVQMRAVLEADLREALRNGNSLAVHYQPQVGTMSGSISGLEALVRWDHPQRGLVPPSLFVPVAEETGLIHMLGDLVLADACEVARQWPGLTIAVNLSPIQFGDETFTERVCEMVRQAGVRPQQIELEVTEGVVLDRSEQVLGALRRLRQEGFRVALDDFGTGYSSLSYLREFEVDKLKIDKSFIQSLGSSMDSGAIVTAVVTLGNAMGLRVTAEGVETADQETFLRGAGCSELQGFRFSQAVPSKDLRVLLKGLVRRAAA